LFRILGNRPPGSKKIKNKAIKLAFALSCLSVVAELNVKVNGRDESRKFKVWCNAGDTGHLEVQSDRASVRIGQRIEGAGSTEIWESVLVKCREQENGVLVVEVIICHPDWEEPLKIATLESNLRDSRPEQMALKCDLSQSKL
jgi:hypothetical protein